MIWLAKFSTKVNQFLDVPTADPDDARRRKLLNIILAGLSIIALAILLVAPLARALGQTMSSGEMAFIIITGAGILAGAVAFYAMNKSQLPGWVASTLFLLFLSLTMVMADSPEQLASGRSLFIFVIPVVAAGILLKPGYVFLFATVSSVEIYILAQVAHSEPNIFAMFGFYMIAVMSWLSSRGLNQALHDLRQTNANLDRLVQERTQELARALVRERVEAGRTRAILESIADGVVVFDLQGKAISANIALVRLLDIPLEELLRADVDSLTHSQVLDAKNRGILAGLLTSPGQGVTSYRVQWGHKTISVSSALVEDSEGERVGTVAVFRDYTREAEIERMKNTFLAIVSHELRTPLNAILGYAEMLKEAIYGPINEKQARASERIMSNVRRLLDIVSDLLDQAQIEAGKLTIQVRPFKLAELLDTVHGVMDKIAGDKGVALTSNLDPELPESINGDPARLQQILVNLSNNAIKFTDKGSVNIRIYRHDKKHWGLEVLDTGIGIPEEELPNIFDAFRQVDSTASRRHGGFGLGLAIVKQLAELMGGDLAVKSKVGVGSIFTITLPLVATKKRRTS
ncbi:MAG: PAS domain S-box protein [Anaerolineales bacterium]|nr:PAS domain S-box protein [Anaerolineales bacterium]